MLRINILSIFVAIIAFLIVPLFITPVYASEAFALMDAGDDIKKIDHYLSIPYIHGAAIRTSWAELEPQKNKYNWNIIDQALQSAHKNKKKITLHILASGYVSPPAWLLQQGVQTYDEKHPFKRNAPPRTQPLPWDNMFLTEWSAFLYQLSTYLKKQKAEPFIAYISIAAPVPEMSLVGCRNGKIGSYKYSRTHYLTAWKSSINMMHQYFPAIKKLISAPVSEICMPDHDGAAFYIDVLKYAQSLNPTAFYTFATDLNAKGSMRITNLKQSANMAPIAFQFIYSATNDPQQRFQGSLNSAICLGHQLYNAGYYEVYKQDIDNPAYTKTIQGIGNNQFCLSQ